MKIRSMLALSALGAAYYAHRRRGGDHTLASVRDSVDALGQWMKDQAIRAKDKISPNRDEPVEAETYEDTGEDEPMFTTPSGFAGGDGLFPGR